MQGNYIFRIFLYICLFMFSSQELSARISSISPWSFQDRRATLRGKFDQSLGFQFGTDGVSPSGADTGASFITLPYHLSYGLADKVEIGTTWGLLWLDRNNKSNQIGIYDLQIAARYRFFEASRTERMPGLDTEFGLSFPTASFDKGLGTGGLGIQFGWGLLLPLDPVRAHVGMGFRLNTENSDNVKVGNVFSYNGGITYPVSTTKGKIDLTAEMKGFNHSRNKISGQNDGPAPDELYLSPGMNWRLHRGFQLMGSFLIGLTSDSSDIGLSMELRF